MKVIELLTDILYYPISISKMYDLNRLYKVPEIFKIGQLCYRLLKHTIREYRPNEIHAS